MDNVKDSDDDFEMSKTYVNCLEKLFAQTPRDFADKLQATQLWEILNARHFPNRDLSNAKYRVH